MKIIMFKDNENPLVKRREIEGKVVFESAVPSREAVRKELAALLKVDEERIVLFGVQPLFGRHEARLRAAVYEDPSAQTFLTPPYILKRGRREEESA